MGNKIKMTESRLISIIEKILSEQASTAGFGYGFVREADTDAPTTPLSAQERELSWGKLREILKDFYDVESVTNPDGTPPQPKDSEVKKMFEGRLHRNLTKSNKRR